MAVTRILLASVGGVAIAMLAVPSAVSAATLSTAIDQNNGQRGVMFDVVIGANALTLTSLSTTIYANTTANYEFYTIAGGITGKTDNSAGWTLRDSFASVSGTTSNNDLTAFDVSDFTLLANTTYGFYFTNTSGGGVSYTGAAGAGAVGSVRAANADLSILTGIGKSYAFGSTFTPRAFNGSLTYTGGTVPEPASWALMIGGFGMVGASMRRRRTSFTAA